MSTLEQRLNEATNHKPDYTAIAVKCGISPQAVKKWWGIGGKTNNIQMDHLFRVSDLLKVNARWLATGEGPKAGERRSAAPAEFPLRRIDMLRMYSRLPKGARYQVRSTIEYMAGLIAEGKWKLTQEEREEIERSGKPDSKAPRTAPRESLEVG